MSTPTDAATSEPSRSEQALLHQADVIIALAKSLLADGRIAEAAEVAILAAPRLQAVRSLQRMREAFGCAQPAGDVITPIMSTMRNYSPSQ